MRKNNNPISIDTILTTCDYKQKIEVSFNHYASYESKRGMITYVVPIGEEPGTNQLEPMRGDYFGQIERTMWLTPSKGKEIMIDKRTIASVRKVYLDKR